MMNILKRITISIVLLVLSMISVISVNAYDDIVTIEAVEANLGSKIITWYDAEAVTDTSNNPRWMVNISNFATPEIPTISYWEIKNIGPVNIDGANSATVKYIPEIGELEPNVEYEVSTVFPGLHREIPEHSAVVCSASGVSDENVFLTYPQNGADGKNREFVIGKFTFRGDGTDYVELRRYSCDILLRTSRFGPVKFKRIAPIEIIDAYANNNIISDSVPYGTDSLKLMVNNSISSQLNSDSVTVYCNNLLVNSVSNLEDNNKAIIVNLLEALKPNSEYIIKFNGILDANNIELSEDYRFTTGDSIGSKMSNIIITNKKNINGNIQIDGFVKGSHGIGISGQVVSLSINASALMDATTDLANDISRDDGGFTLSYLMDEDKGSGVYPFYIESEYANLSCDIPIRFLSNTDMLNLFTQFVEVQDADDVKEIFTNNSDIFGIDLATDLIGINDDTKLFDRFIGKEFLSVDEILDMYYSCISLEKINQASDINALRGILENETDCMQLGIYKDPLSLIFEFQSEFLSEVFAIGRVENLEEYVKTFNKILNVYLKEKYQVDNANVNVNVKSISVGQDQKIDFVFTDEQINVSKINLTLVLGNALCNKVSFLTQLCEQVNVKIDGEKVNLTLIPKDTSRAISEIGYFEFLADEDVVGTYDLVLTGTVEYAFDELPVTVNSEVLANTTTFTIKSLENVKNDDNPRDNIVLGSGGGGGGMSVSSKPATEIKPNASLNNKNETEPKDMVFPFKDCDSVEWAKDAINELYARGIISGTSKEQFNPDDVVTREEFVKMVVCAAKYPLSLKGTGFADVNSEDWYAPYVNTAVEYGIITGINDKKFGVKENVSRQDMMVMLYRMIKQISNSYNYQTDENKLFEDDDQIADYAKEAVYALKKMSITNGVSNNLFAPEDKATRAMAAKLIYETIRRVGL